MPNLVRPILKQRSSLVLSLLLILSGLPMGGFCDALAELPQTWRNRLQPLAMADLSGAEPYARKVIQEQRDTLARLLTDAATETPDLAEAYGRLGALYQVFHLPAAAQTSYQNAMTLDPDNFRWVYYAGYLASRNGRHGEALERYRIAQDLKPDYPPLALRLGQSSLELNRLDEASSALQEAAEDPGLRAMALYQLAQLDLLQRRYATAVERLEAVLQLDPRADQAHYPLALALRAQGEDARARQQLALQGKRLPEVIDPLIRDLESLNQGARQYFAEALQASRKQAFTAAAQAFALGLAIEPDNLNARVSYARALLLAGQQDQAAQQLQRVLQQSPGHTLALFLSAILLEDKGNISQAMTRYQQVLEQEPSHYGAHYCLANRFYQAGGFSPAARHYASALASNPEIPPARLYELLALKQSGHGDAEIRRHLEALIATHPDQQILRYALIRLLVLSKDPQVRDLEQARQGVNELVQQAFIPPHVELQALVAAALGHYEQAVSLQQQVLPGLLWLGTDAHEQAEQSLAAYQRNELPQQAWFRDQRLLLPPRTDVRLLFREYPSATPY